ncbi:Protein of unknown function (DUF3421) [Popillia japonica]|uniref:Uncharacterized protein n=1 Tax=Popillia japonica TaxID=7064 RepID=A0AAW1N4J2_POPJA
MASGCWVPAASGDIPQNAFVGGEDNGETLFVARGSFGDSQVPGKLLASHGCCYVPWGGKENPLTEYEVLCDFNGDWIECSGASIPQNAFPAGESEDGEPLYIGRVFIDGTLTIGKVQESHGVCYVPYDGKEESFQDYQILVTY